MIIFTTIIVNLAPSTFFLSNEKNPENEVAPSFIRISIVFYL